MSDSASLAVELVDDAIVLLSLGVFLIVDPRVEKLTGQFASTRVAVASLTAKLSDPDDACVKSEAEHDNFGQKIRTEMKTAKGHNIAERNGALPRYFGVF